MKAPRRIQRKRTKGWRMPEGAVYVGRPSDFSNHFRLERDGTGWLVRGPGVTIRGELEPFDKHHAAELAVERFREAYAPDSNNAYWARVRLRGRDLACWCPEDQPCHADVLLEAANSEWVAPHPSIARCP